ncbi:14219_t:CDS:1, partial [Rhizophagus irregularis]
KNKKPRLAPPVETDEPKQVNAKIFIVVIREKDENIQETKENYQQKNKD